MARVGKDVVGTAPRDGDGGTGRTSSTVATLVPKDATALMPPPPPMVRPQHRARRQKVLDEDEWTERLDAIITRDYFPHVPRLKNKLEWLEARNSGDPEQMRRAQENIQRRQRDALGTPGGILDTPSLGGSSGSGVTPGSSVPGTPRGGYYGGIDATQLAAAANRAADSRMSLDQFAAKHTSEDNDSFREILETHNAKRSSRYGWQQQATMDAKEAERTLRIEAGERDMKRRRALGNGDAGSVTDGSGTEDGTEDGVGAPLRFTKFKAKNELYYPPDGLAPSAAEMQAMVQGPPKETVSKNTRFAAPRRVNRRGHVSSLTPTPTPGRFVGDEDAAERVARELEAAVRGKNGEMYTSAGVGRRAYGLVHTPAGATPRATPRATPARATPSARGDDSPAVGGEFWGASTATPLHGIDDDMDAYFEDLGGSTSGGGPEFGMRPMDKREELLRKLTDSRAKRTPGRGGATPARSGRTPMMSPAAAALAQGRNPGGVTPSFDAALRGSYSGRTPRGTPASTPKVGARAGGAATPRVGGSGSATPARGAGALTDDLLKI